MTRSHGPQVNRARFYTNKLSRQKIPYRVVKMLQSKVYQIDKCTKCIYYNAIISSSEIQKFCKSKEDMLPKSGFSASQSDQSSQSMLSKDGTPTSSASSKDQVKIRKITFQENEEKGTEIIFMDLSSKIRLKQGDRITIGTRKEEKDVQFQVVSRHVYINKGMNGSFFSPARFYLCATSLTCHYIC
jgi:hypothetical protein